MSKSPVTKSTVEEIRRRFDGDVERFSDLAVGQQAAPDSPLCMDLVTEAAAAVTPHARTVLDVGCGAGNYALKLLQRLPGLDVTLLDLSRPMLDRAVQRVSAAGAGTPATVTAVQADVREAASDPGSFDPGSFDIILAAATLHHLRDQDQWRSVFAAFYRWLRPGGSLWVVDLVEQATPELEALTRRRYGDYLTTLGGEAYREAVLAYVDKEDTPRPLVWQLRRLEEAGFTDVDVLHKRLCMAAFGGRRRHEGTKG
ncbi:MAG: class I SAM-dependent methyltransferase [Phycisphaerae bacterium]